MSKPAHLTLIRHTLPPGIEWAPSRFAWAFVRVKEGYIYWLASGQTLEIKQGDLLVRAAQVAGKLRASQIGAAELDYFTCTLDHLNGLFTPSEHHSASGLEARSAAFVYRANEPTAQLFTSICEQEAAGSAVQRSRMLQLMAEVCASHGEIFARSPSADLSSAERFDQLMNQLPEAELLDYSLSELAGECGCSVRHFRRLFRYRFRTSLRAKVTELRLAKARLLLSNTNLKIIHVALESGYRHLGLFNATFKRAVGVTPSQWRNKYGQVPRHRRSREPKAISLTHAANSI